MSAECGVVDIRALGPGDDAAVVAAQHLFDGAAKPAAVAAFLADGRHHLLVAYEDGVPAGFVSGVELTHPDKGTELMLYELSVDDAFRRRGIGRALVDALAALGRDRGCYGMFVLTDLDNEAAQRTYRGSGARDDGRHLMLTWDF